MTAPASDVSRRDARRRARRGPERRRWVRWVLGGVGALLLIVIGAALWVGIRGLLAKDHLEQAVPLANATKDAIVAGDTTKAMDVSRELSDHAREAAALTSDPLWRAAEGLPWAGPNLTSMRVVAASVDRIATGAVSPLAEAAAQLDLAAFKPEGGRVDLAPVIALQAPVHEASVALADAQQTLATVADADVIEPLADARDDLATTLDETAATVDALDRAVRLVPAMLGADGPRDILLLFQNNAELRTLGGIPGALALVHTDQGSFDLVQQADSGDFPRYDPPVVDLPVETRALWGDNTARFIQDVTFAPQFPLGASIAADMWLRQFGVAPASVVAVDPVVLSYLLRATGPVTLPTGEQLTSDNAVPVLLQDVYARFDDPRDQDAYFAMAAASVIGAVRGGGVDPRALVEALVEAGAERRILIWNADAAEQAILDGTTLAGDLPVSGPGRQAFGVYLNDLTGSKMDPYLDVQFAAGSMVCRNDGLPTYVVEVTLTNTAPADAATSLPEYVTGGGSFGTPPGEISTSVHVYSAPGTFNLGVTQNGGQVNVHETSDSGYALSKVTARLAPGQAVSWRFSFLGDVPEQRPVVIESTPLVYAREASALTPTCDSALN
ncbi:DUF4012 domain-containing protein [Agromyces protaetiae]|uniref:DUF4012 domain-containing protein n=1 Tax=Agromyces protaetiae TaxID=2509455 RepID=A0A4P6FVR9_9MICO|nr:DUF4012 domain-containing protein [Agromyces protaetiae]QAY74708.1 DUF4012 domain-containing protein [Agromyces protaetiae]